jgi:hypothetical protein
VHAAPVIAAGIADTPPAGMPTVSTRAATEKGGDDVALGAGHAKSRIANLPARPPGADEIDPATAAMVATPQYLGEAIKRDPVAAVTAAPDTAGEVRERSGATDASSLVRALVAEAVPVNATNGSGPAPQATLDTTSAAVTAPVRAVEEAVTTPVAKPASSTNALIAEPITVVEAGKTSVAVTDVVTVTGSDETAVVTATPRFLISEQPSNAPLASTEPARTAATPEIAAEPSPEPARHAVNLDVTTAAPRVTLDEATPEATEDEPSDGVVRMIATADTARMGRSTRMRPPTPEHDGPPIKETTGEIRERPRSDTKEPAVSEPTILVADLAAAHDAAAAVLSQPVAAPPPPDAASPSRELAVSEVRRDAATFTDTDEAFFQRADKSAPVPRVVMPETFEDLDEGYQPPKFWDRVFGRKPKKPG